MLRGNVGNNRTVILIRFDTPENTICVESVGAP